MSRAADSVERAGAASPAADEAVGGDERGARARVGAGLLAAAGACLAAGGLLHPHGSGATLEESLGAMLGSPGWGPSHLLVLVGLMLAVIGFALVRRSGVLGSALRPWLTAVLVTWSLAAVETVPHLLAGGEHEAHLAGGPTPMTDAHLLLSTVTTPLLAVSTALLAVQIARHAGTVSAWLLAGFALLGAVTFGAASPLIALTGNPATSVLFTGQLFIDVWLIGTAVRLLPRR